MVCLTHLLIVTIIVSYANVRPVLSCTTTHDCNIHEVCIGIIFKQCRPEPNYRWEENKYVYYTCYNNKQCQVDWDLLRECDVGTGKCRCGHDERADLDNGGMCMASTTECETSSTCAAGEVCINKWCRCAPDYQWDNDQGKCVQFKCTTNAECEHSWDDNKMCDKSNGRCVCDDSVWRYRENKTNGQRCEMFTPKACVTDSACAPTELCVGGKCWCRPNERWDDRSERCVAYRCSTDHECTTDWDLMRKCNAGKCVCYSDTYKEDPKQGYKCTSGALNSRALLNTRFLIALVA